MSKTKRATVYFDPELHRALRLEAAATEQSVSEIVNDAVRMALAEDAADIKAFVKRRREPDLDLEEVVNGMRRRGTL